MTRTIGVVTVGRSDYGIYRPVLQRIAAEPALGLQLFVGGMHLRDEFGLTVRAIEQDRFPIVQRIATPTHDDSPAGVAHVIGDTVCGFGAAYARQCPDLLLVLGDRFEMHAAALAAVPFGLPIAHIHGGELTLGAIDDVLRHGITKMAHLHFVATETYARRVRQLGEESWRVVVSGAPALDRLVTWRAMSRDRLAERLGFPLPQPPLLVNFYPVTRDHQQTEWHVAQLLRALAQFDGPMVFTATNADTRNSLVRAQIAAFITSRAHGHYVANVGEQYFDLMAVSRAMVGNSSSGLIEAPSFALPVVNIGARQGGRIRAANVIDCDHDAGAIVQALQRALTPAFREGLRGLRNPYGDGHAAERIVDRLIAIPLDQRLRCKPFVDYALPNEEPEL